VGVERLVVAQSAERARRSRRCEGSSSGGLAANFCSEVAMVVVGCLTERDEYALNHLHSDSQLDVTHRQFHHNSAGI
jgi:hypothetical protein